MPGRASRRQVDVPNSPARDASPHGVHEQSVRDRAALAAALDPIVTIDFTGRIQSASDSVQRVLGWTPSELVGRNVNVLMPEPHHSAHDNYLSNYQRTGKTNIMNRSRRFDAMRKDGSLIPIELCVSRADVPDGGAPLFVGIIRDMSAVAAAERTRDEERVRAQQLLAEQTSALQQANARLRMADRMASIGTLAAGLGHDMNNVLLPVRARLNALKASGHAGNLAKQDRDHVEQIASSVAYLQQLADGLHFLALDPDTEADARGSGRTTDIARWWAQAGPLLSKAVPKHVRVLASFPPGLPPVAVAPHALTQAILNLVVNAGEAIPPPSERKRRQGFVRLRAEMGADADWIRIGVTDNGSGMSDDVKRRAFEMFFTTKPRGLGTGLGLALVRKVAEDAGGFVGIESQPGKGTTVTMSVPPAQAPGRAGSDADRPGAVISIADGRAAALIRHMLESAGKPVRADAERANANIWIIEPASDRLAEATAWRRRDPNVVLVLFGKPRGRTSSAWNALNPVIIDAPDDYESVRGALARVLAMS